MKTFDEAVMIAMVARVPHDAPDTDPAVMKEMGRPIELQRAFVDDVAVNCVLQLAISSAVLELVVELSDDDTDTECVLANGLLSSFLWGLAVGREMEKTDA